MADVVLRELETLAKERREDVATIIANAVKIGIEKIRQETILERYLKKLITREAAIKLVGVEVVRRAERQREAVLEDVEWDCMDKAVSNTGPPIHLAEIGEFELLKSYSRIYIPEKVHEEVRMIWMQEMLGSS